MEDRLVSLHGGAASLVLSVAKGERPSVVYWGARLDHADAGELASLSVRQAVPGLPDVDVAPSFLNEAGAGLTGPPGIEGHRGGHDWAPVLAVQGTEQPCPASIRVHCRDEASALRAEHLLRLDPETGVLEATTTLTNEGTAPYELRWLTPICLPLGPPLDHLTTLIGRWAGEFAEETTRLPRGGLVRENRTGRTGHDGFPGLIARAAHTTETSGPGAAFHLAWSGNNRLRADRWPDGRAFVQMGELFGPPGGALAPGASYRTPTLHAAWSEEGLVGLTDALHPHVRGRIMDGRARRAPRPVTYNSWEAVYFDHDEDELMRLATLAASVGAERFVLDDGWFGGRRSDRAGLGDWQVASSVYPNGLGPLAEHVRSLGMAFGLWFEPEMVNPDSALYRAHPDWVLSAPGRSQVPMRHQLALDLTKPAVADHLFERMDALIGELGVSCVKWDANRDLHHPGSDGRHVAGAQVRATYALMDRLRAAHPALEIEACASGGARADYGVLARTDRVWTSDQNDALDRTRIMRGASRFLPLCVLGNHVGPDPCHVTGRRLSTAFRVGAALFGHMGMELDLRAAPPADLATLRAGIALHKEHRALIHEGRLVRLDAPQGGTPGSIEAFCVVAPDAGEALASVAVLCAQADTHPGRLRLHGLAPGGRYRLRLVWPEALPSVGEPSPIEAASVREGGTVLTGEALTRHGLPLPVTHPETCLVYHLARTG